MTEQILVINSGSSTLKYADYDRHSMECRKRETIELDRQDYDAVLKDILSRYSNIAAVGHRVVHGGREFVAPVRIDENVLKKLQQLIPLAPLHQPHNLKAIKHIREICPEMPQIACFDTAFHRNQPVLNQLYALPQKFTDEGILRYGFHGLSYEYIASVLPEYTDQADGNVIVLHLGSGASGCAMKGRKSLSSTMGFTALEGLMMGTRCGQIDPGVILYLLQEKGMSAEEVTDLLYTKSGLLGVSGGSADMRDLIERKEPHVGQAIDLFCHYAVRAIGQLAADLCGLDVLVFTGGIGEHQPLIRDKITDALDWLHPEVHIIPTDEEKMIAMHMAACLSSARR